MSFSLCEVMVLASFPDVKEEKGKGTLGKGTDMKAIPTIPSPTTTILFRGVVVSGAVLGFAAISDVAAAIAIQLVVCWCDDRN